MYTVPSCDGPPLAPTRTALDTREKKYLLRSHVRYFPSKLKNILVWRHQRHLLRLRLFSELELLDLQRREDNGRNFDSYLYSRDNPDARVLFCLLL
jgi:hypothetical protein